MSHEIDLPTWGPCIVFVRGQTIARDGEVWMCRKPHTSGAVPFPSQWVREMSPADTAYWDNLEADLTTIGLAMLRAPRRRLRSLRREYARVADELSRQPLWVYLGTVADDYQSVGASS